MTNRTINGTIKQDADGPRPGGDPRPRLARLAAGPPGTAVGHRRRGPRGLRRTGCPPTAPTRPQVVDQLAAAATPGLMAMPVRPVLRLGDRRHAPAGAGSRLAGQRLGPELRAALRDPAAAAIEECAARLAARTARAARRPPTSASPPAPPWRTSPASARPAPRSSATRVGRQPRRADRGARGSGCSSARSGTTRSTCALRYLGLGRPERRAGRRAGPHRGRRA